MGGMTCSKGPQSGIEPSVHWAANLAAELPDRPKPHESYIKRQLVAIKVENFKIKIYRYR